jgi:bifunctional N6-L-threonylcarbamoyladenine synthase / protein kinase Bud32
MGAPRFVLALDTANEVIAVGIGELCAEERRVKMVVQAQVEAHRASNTRLLECVDAVLGEAGVSRGELACVACGRGPGSFTGVRIAMATAKGIASALHVGLIGLSTLDAVAWGAWESGARGEVLVAANAMRREIYPVTFSLSDAGVVRLDNDRVIKATNLADELEGRKDLVQITGDALAKYADLLSPNAVLLPKETWAATGAGLLLALQAAWVGGECDPFDVARHNPAFALPVYTRLSDAEENERQRLAKGDASTKGTHGDRHVTMNDTSINNSRGNAAGIAYKPLDAVHAVEVARLESEVMGTDAWNANLVVDELGRADRVWWMALACDPSLPVPIDAPLVGYAGGMVVDGDVQILKIATDVPYQRRGIARALLAHVADDARSLGASTISLEVRVGNEGAIAFYESRGFETIGKRPRYYSDGEDAFIMKGFLSDILAPTHERVGGMSLQMLDYKGEQAKEKQGGEQVLSELVHPLMFAIESSCDETAASIVDGAGTVLASVVASQIDFHARFGGVVPEIASRKHIEAICGVCDECFDVAAAYVGLTAGSLTWSDMDAVAVTYAPGLLGALVVGVAFAKGAAWGAEKPFIGVNHLEGHLYANKIGRSDFAPPAVVSLVSGGNTLLVHMKEWGVYETLGYTIDDAVGEAFDKVAKALGLGYPGGPIISQMATEGDPTAIPFPRAMMHSGDLRFSLSGLKTAVTTYINQEREAGRELNVPDICASFTAAVVDVQVAKAKTALEQTGAKEFCLGGGVAANPSLRAAYEEMCHKMGVRLTMPPMSACTDNAAMIALVALDRYKAGKFFPLSADAQAHADLDKPY